jgi:hypothetical protein
MGDLSLDADQFIHLIGETEYKRVIKGQRKDLSFMLERVQSNFYIKF